MGLKKLGLYGGLFLAGVSIGGLTTAASSNFVRFDRYQKASEQMLDQAVEECNHYEAENRDVPKELRRPLTIRQEGATSLIFLDEYCPVKQEQIKQEIQMYKKAKFNPLNVWR